MSLDTIISAGLSRPTQSHSGLVLMGGGARTAYQVGVLRALGAILRNEPRLPKHFPFQILVGTSAGAINAAFLAGQASRGLEAFSQLAQFWSDIRSSDVYRLNVPPWVRYSKVAAAFALTRQARKRGAILDTAPLVDTLAKCISLDGIEDGLRNRTLEAVAVTASSYSSGTHWTFCHTAQDGPFQGWSRPGRRAEFHALTINHLMASSAIPFLFPATAITLGGRAEYFGDGSMRQVSPLSPAMHLGAQRVLVIGAGQPERSVIGSGPGGSDARATPRSPTLAGIAGHAMASVFHDTLQADVEQTQRVSQTLKRMPRDDAAALPYRSVEVMAIQPTQSLDALAYKHAHELPTATRHALSGLGILRGGGGAIVSYLLFEPGFIQSLIAMGESDAHARKADLLAFF
jgi:NTE family protein